MLLQAWLTVTNFSKSDIQAVATLLMPAGRKERQYALRVKNQFGVHWYQCQLSILISVTFGSCISFFTFKSFTALGDGNIYPLGMYDECIPECCRNFIKFWNLEVASSLGLVFFVFVFF